MVNTKSRKIKNNKAMNPKGLGSCIQTENGDAIQIPFWFLKGMLNKDFNLRLTFNQIDKGGNKPPLEIPVWLFKNLLRQDNDLPMTVNQVASILEVHPKTVQRWIRLGLIGKHSSSSRGSPRFLVADVIDALMNMPNIQRLFKWDNTVPSKN